MQYRDYNFEDGCSQLKAHCTEDGELNTKIACTHRIRNLPLRVRVAIAE